MDNALLNAMPKEVMAGIWNGYDWKAAEAELLKYQQELAKAAFGGDADRQIELQKKIVRSDFAKMLAVRKVCGAKGTVGTDNVKWITPDEKYAAAISLTSKGYKATPYRHIIIESKNGKQRHINIPTYYDKAMQVLYAFSLNPIAEATGERKSFAFRIGRSMQDANEYIKEALKPYEIEYVVKADVKACYHSISHEWLMNNIPMDKKVLGEFLNAGYIFNGELFPTDDYGISLGCNISPILGNMTLDGMQKYIYARLYGDGEINYTNGNLIRFADDIIVTVTDTETAEKILEILSDFLSERGLRLSEEKTKIIEISQGFDFLSRTYKRKDGVITVEPSKTAVTCFENELEDFILNFKGSQKSLIDKLNRKLSAWAGYHRVSNAASAFRHIDVVVKALLIKLCQKKHPTWTLKKIRGKYFYLEHNGEYIYALKDRVDIRVKKLSDALLVEHKKIKTNANAYLDADYIEQRTDGREIHNVTGKYRSVWNRQNGRCFYCGKKILPDQPKEIIQKSLAKGGCVDNLAYIHYGCRHFPAEIIHADAEPLCENDIIALINSLDDRRNKKGLKFSQLDIFFQKCLQPTVTLTFKEIENIIGAPLCKTAYERKQYWFKTTDDAISKVWLMNGYIIKRLYLNKRKIVFVRAENNNLPVDIPDVFLNGRVPKDAKFELENFFSYIRGKYGI